jgi:uncharacterized protein
MKRNYFRALVWLVASGLSHAADSGPALSSAGTRPGADSIPQAYPHAVVKPVGLSEARITGGYLGAYVDRTRDVSVLDLFGKMEQRGLFRNFTIVATGAQEKYNGGVAEDEWVFKLVEAAGFFSPQSQTIHATFQPLMKDIMAAQDHDGYLQSYYQNPLVKAKQGYQHFLPSNAIELYAFGHLAQAGIAWQRATGNDRLLHTATKYADLICDSLGAGPLPRSKKPKPSRHTYKHPNHEMAMVELYRMTGNLRYLDFAKHTLDDYKFWSKPEVYGHCVEENNLLCGGADVYLETGKSEWLQHLEAMWKDITERKMYVTGGVGDGRDSENYSAAYSLPNNSNYSETCAAISKVFFNWRMLLATGRVQYADDMERTFYNAVLSGVSLSGKEYFYTNAMECRNPNGEKILFHKPEEQSQRQPYFKTSCCAPNFQRLIGSLQQYLFTEDKNGVQAQLYGSAEIQTQLSSGATVHLRETTDYPRDGQVRFDILADGNFTLSLRIPQWTEGSEPRVAINGQTVPTVQAGTFLRLDRAWKAGDRVTLDFDLKPRLIAGRDRVADEKGKLVLMRGPVVYCLESPDNPQVDLFSLSLAASAKFVEARSDALGGMVRLTGSAWDATKNTATPVTAVPYHLWANRGRSTMRIWIPEGQ